MEDLDIDEAPTSIDPYKVLDLTPTATAEQVKTAYRKAALKWHPDKVSTSDKETAHTKFQEIAFAYAILSDARRRSRYDITGRTAESLDLDSSDDFDWIAFYRAQFADVVTGSAISDFTSRYKNSDEERADLLAAYEKGKGDMNVVYSRVMTSDPAEDDARFRGIINEAIEKGEVEGFEKFVKESRKSVEGRIQRARKNGREAEEYARKIGVHEKLFGKDKTGGGGGGGDGGALAKKGKKSAGGEDDLAALIQQRQKGRAGDFLADLEAKYAAPKGKKGKKRASPDDEPPEEAFARNAERQKKGKKARGEVEDESAGTRKSKRVKS